MKLDIDDEVIEKLSKWFTKDVGYEPNKADLEGDIENLILEALNEEVQYEIPISTY